MAKNFLPAVSIIIPMYNAEKFIGECLGSLLAQTFQDFEIIVVDDCSTDNSVNVVESYLPKFDDKLRLVKLKENSGSPGTPRNVAINLSRGEYLMFVDSDDAITKTALEEIYPLAKKFDADVVHTEKYYKPPLNTLTTDKNFLKEDILIQTDFVNQPTLMTNDILERIQIFVSRKFDWTTWQNFVRRDFLIENNIKFPAHKVQVDTIFSFMLLCLAKRILRVPNIFYVYRYRADSVCRPESMPPEKAIERWGGALLRSLVLLDKFVETLDVYKTHRAIKHTILDAIVRFIGAPIYSTYSVIPMYEVHDLMRKELAKIEGDTTAITIFLFDRMNLYYHDLIHSDEIIRRQQETIQQLKAQLRQQRQKFHDVVKIT